MSIDVQMFVICDHILNVPRLDNPSNPLLVSTALNTDEKLKLVAGTYYVAHTYVSKHNIETQIGPVAKIYISEENSLIISAEDISNNDTISATNIYVSHTSENLTHIDLTTLQLAKEKDIIENLIFQDNLIEGDLEMLSLSLLGETHPKTNRTNVASYADRSGACPRCYGKNYYFDIYFDQNGKAVTATKSQKLLQECLKILIEDKLSNKYHPEWGCDVSQRVGTKNAGSIEKFKVELSVRDAIEYLKQLQLNSQLQYMNMNDEEIIESIQSIKVEKDGPTGYNVDIVLVSKVGAVISYPIIL